MARDEQLRLEIKRLEEHRDKIRNPAFEQTFGKLFDRLALLLGAAAWVVYGPFGLCCERTVYFVQDKQCITVDGNVLGSLTFIDGGSGGFRLRDRTKHNNTFEPGTIGALNGMNHPSIEITEQHTIAWLAAFAKREA